MPALTKCPSPYADRLTPDQYEGHRLPANDPTWKIWSVGASPLDAIRALARARWHTVEVNDTCITDELFGDPREIDWAYYVTSGGVGFKVAGINVPGGVILTWWK